MTSDVLEAGRAGTHGRVAPACDGGPVLDPTEAELHAVAVAAALAAGAELVSRYRHPPAGVRSKRRPADLVSEADLAAERAIADILKARRPDDGVLAEEGVASREGTTAMQWVVDPLDGTTNFLADLPLWCVSIACADRLGARVGVVFDPTRNELFSAVRGHGATLNRHVLRPRGPASLAAATVAGTVTCFTTAEATRHAVVTERFFQRAGHRRSLGSAALELAWTAAGRLDICYQEQHIHPWDVDAGLLICREAGLAVYCLAPAAVALAPRYLVAPPRLARTVLRHTRPRRPAPVP